MDVVEVRSEEDAAAVRRLVAEFVDWLGVRYPDRGREIAEYFRIQRLDHQMANLLTVFAPPQGECLLARLDGVACGTVMLKPSAPGVCEMNRMFVTEAARGRGVGLALGRRLIERARALGYRRMVLSAGIDHREAIPLYRKLGFAADATLPDTGAGDLEYRMALDL